MGTKLAPLAADAAAAAPELQTCYDLLMMESAVLAIAAASAANLWLFDSDLLAVKSRQK